MPVVHKHYLHSAVSRVLLLQSEADAGCGVVPMRHAHLSDWTRSSYTADGEFYSALSELVPRTYLIKKVSSHRPQAKTQH